MSEENPVFEKIKDNINSNSIFLYMKGTPEAPMCGFSAQVVGLLNSLNISYGSFDVLSDGEIRQGIKEFADWPTIPQLYIKGEFVGGCDIVTEMYQNGDLQKMVAEVSA